MRLTNVQYHIIKDDRLNVDILYDELLEIISDYASTVVLNHHEECHYEIVALPVSSIFGRSSV